MNAAGTYSVHGARGPLPAGESGLSVRIETFKRGPCYCAAVLVDTPRGPLHVAACVDERHVAHALGVVRRLVRALGISPDQALPHAYARVAQVRRTSPSDLARLPAVPWGATTSSPSGELAKALVSRELVSRLEQQAPGHLGPANAAVLTGAAASLTRSLRTVDGAYRGRPHAQRQLIQLSRLAQSPTPAGRAAQRTIAHALTLLRAGRTQLMAPSKSFWRVVADRISAARPKPSPSGARVSGFEAFGAEDPIVMGAESYSDLVGGTYVHPESVLHPCLVLQEQGDLLGVLGAVICF